MALATAAEVRAVANGWTSADDTLITTVLARADSALASHLGYPRADAGARTLESATYTLYPDRYAIGWGEDSLYLSVGTPRLISITSVHVDTGRDYDAASLLAATEYEADGRSLVLTDTATTGWSSAIRANKLVVVAGHTADDVLKRALILQAVHWLGNDPTAGTSSTQAPNAGSRSTHPLGLLPEVVTMVAPFVLVVP